MLSIGIVSLVAVVVMTVATSSLNSGVKMSTWQPLPGDAVVLMTMALEPRSKLQCAFECLSAALPCVTFCFSGTTSSCYLAVELASPADTSLHVGANVTCYRKGPCSSRAAGYSDYAGRCLKGYSDRLSYESASVRCSADGGHLFHYKTLTWDKPPAQELVEDAGFTAELVWVGADDSAVEGTWQRSDGTTFGSTSDLWYLAGEPNNLNGGEDCAALYTSNQLLLDLPCTNLARFICQIDL
ncbi:hypothetical protein BaRGS_00009241 [Batillaria attramentaria]|uniref:C-type lectin domain-containing protein n=1 Tax=Batillaria attramentaria TaxID=370345 RepID=A0ABD0LJ93_9CAEN